MLPGMSLSLNAVKGDWEMGIPSSTLTQSLHVPTPMMGPGAGVRWYEDLGTWNVGGAAGTMSRVPLSALEKEGF